ncbi:hypothetical protein [Dolichospermum compactum]|uniref:hypothetical protein n=1 Tax=Dolichospermum compactum TaxID=136073 RepID=UPI0012FD693B|nr:hypothetical protein [Dolichospermum compactum]
MVVQFKFEAVAPETVRPLKLVDNILIADAASGTDTIVKGVSKAKPNQVNADVR